MYTQSSQRRNKAGVSRDCLAIWCAGPLHTGSTRANQKGETDANKMGGGKARPDATQLARLSLLVYLSTCQVEVAKGGSAKGDKAARTVAGKRRRYKNKRRGAVFAREQ